MSVFSPPTLTLPHKGGREKKPDSIIGFVYEMTPKRTPNTKPPAELVPDPAVAKEKLKLLWIACGKKDRLIRISQGVHAYLKEKGVPHVWHVEGNAHDPTECRNNLYRFAQRIFR